MHFDIADADNPLASEVMACVFASYSSRGEASFDQATAPAGWNPDAARPPIS